MAGNLAITVCRNGTRASTWKPKIPRRSLLFPSACLLYFASSSPCPPHLAESQHSTGEDLPLWIPSQPDPSLCEADDFCFRKQVVRSDPWKFFLCSRFNFSCCYK